MLQQAVNQFGKKCLVGTENDTEYLTLIDSGLAVNHEALSFLLNLVKSKECERKTTFYCHCHELRDNVA